MGQVEVINKANMEQVICLCDKQGGFYINYPTMALVWNHRVFALCLDVKDIGVQMEWHLITQVVPKQPNTTASIKTPLRNVDTHYAIVGTDGLEMYHANYAISNTFY